MDLRTRLFCPGPTPIPLDTLLEGVLTQPYHRSQPFKKIFLTCRELLAPLFGSKSSPMILASSGTGAMEAAVTNLTAPNDKVITLNGGKFGRRWGELCQAYGCEVIEMKFPWGESPNLERLEQLVRNSDAKAFFFQGNETSTGVHYPVAEIAKIVTMNSNALVVVDAISSLGASELKMDQWLIDAVVAGSQKGLGVPAGLSFVNLSEKAWKNISSRQRFYFDLERERKEQDEGSSAFTPATSLILQLYKAIKRIHEIGLNEFVKHHQRAAAGVRAGMQDLGLPLFAKNHPSPSVTSVYLEGKINGSELLSHLQESYKMTFAGGQGEYKNKLLRFAHLGFFDPFDLANGLMAIEATLKYMGFSHCLSANPVATFWNRYHNS